MNEPRPASRPTSPVNGTPAELAAMHPGKHQIYTYGQQQAEGVACIGCSWQSTSRRFSSVAAIGEHDTDMGLVHDHDLWIPIERGPVAGTCPCGKPDLYEDSLLRSKLQAILRQTLPWSLTPEQLTEVLIGAIVPADGMVVSFKTIAMSESDWEAGYTASSTDLTSPQILAHRLGEREQAELYFQIEAVGTLGESDAYSQLNMAVELITEPAARAVRERASQASILDFTPDS